MDVLRNVLREVKEGKREFAPASESPADLNDFQPIAKALIYAHTQSFLERCIPAQTSVSGDLQYNVVLVPGGLSYRGEQFLLEEDAKGESEAENSNQRDPLTKLLNRGAFDNKLSDCVAKATIQQPASLAIADIDHFKKFNDGHGHQTGDAVLQEFAQLLMAVVKGKGYAYRYGGEEFALILPNHTLDEALVVTERARRETEALKVSGLSITSSFGVATVPTHAKTPKEWVKKADDALYEAKNLGRNLVRFSGEPPPQPNQPRQPARKQAVAGVISDEEKEQLRLRILRSGGADCPKDGIPLRVEKVDTVNSLGGFMVYCPGCGFNANLQGVRPK